MGAEKMDLKGGDNVALQCESALKANAAVEGKESFLLIRRCPRLLLRCFLSGLGIDSDVQVL